MLVDISTQLLNSLGYQVTATTSSIEALEIFRNAPEKFDMLISDMTMPETTGDTLAMQIKGYSERPIGGVADRL